MEYTLGVNALWQEQPTRCKGARAPLRVSEIGCGSKELTLLRSRQISHPDKIPDKINENNFPKHFLIIRSSANDKMTRTQ